MYDTGSNAIEEVNSKGVLDGITLSFSMYINTH